MVKNLYKSSLIFLIIYNILNNVFGFNNFALTKNSNVLRGKTNTLIKMFQTSDYLNNLNKNNKIKLPFDSSFYLNSLNEVNTKTQLQHKLYEYLKNVNSTNLNTNSTKQYKFNTLYFNIRKIERIFIDKQFTKIILNIRNDNEKKIYFVNNSNELEQVNSLVQQIPNTISKFIISDVLDDILGYIYHDIINHQ